MSDCRQFKNEQLKGIKFLGCGLAQAEFDDVDLSRAKFNDVSLRDSSFTDINLQGAKISNVNLANVVIEDVKSHQDVALVPAMTVGETRGGSVLLIGGEGKHRVVQSLSLAELGQGVGPLLDLLR